MMKKFLFTFFNFVAFNMMATEPCLHHASRDGQCSNLENYICNDETPAKEVMSEVSYQTVLQKMRSKKFKNKFENNMLKTIQNEKFISKEQKTKFSKIVKETHFVYEMEDGMELGLSDKGLEYLKSIRILACGLEGGVPNAMAIYIENRKIITICPGTILKVASPDEEPENLANIFTFLIGHETGHFLYKENEDDYTSYKKCLLKDPSHENLTKESTANIFKIIFGELRVGPHLNEIAADYWGNRAVAQMLKDNPTQDTFKQNYNFMCKLGEKDDGEHPGLTYRLNYLTRQDEGIAKALDCPTSKGCALK